MSDIYIFRHGQASFGSGNYDKLSETGILQAGILAEYIYKTGLRFDAVYSGSLERQKDTARIFLEYYSSKGLNTHHNRVREEFNEFKPNDIMTAHLPALAKDEPGLLDDLKNIFTDKKSFQRIFEKAMMRWVSGKYDTDGLETWKQYRDRVCGGVRAVMDENGRGKKVAIFASGGTIAASIQLALSITDEDAMRMNWQIVNTSINRFMYNEDSIALASFNSYAHLEMHDNKRLITYR
jgi:broad specificity phosphatase PhoE